MTTAQHANNILDAWRFQDHSTLGAALESASNSRVVPTSGLESERGELLESIVEHLRKLSSQDQLPAAAGRNGALALLSHLSSPANAARVDAFNQGGKTLDENNSSWNTKLPK